MKFRTLKADEIECRVSTINEKGLSLLLYKDARADQTLLDETVGSMNWQRHHSRDNANCIVSIWDEDKKQWVEKEDTGTESYTEKEKGLASDSFKRACFNWGIGRELYTAPFVWIPASKCAIVDGRNGKKTCYDRFFVEKISYDSKRRICELYIANSKTKKNVFSFGQAPETSNTVRDAQILTLENLCRDAKINLDSWLSLESLTRETVDSDWIVKAIASVKHKLEDKK